MKRARYFFCVEEGTLGLLAPDPRQRAFGSLDSHSEGIIVGWRPGSRRASRACGGHGAQRVRRDAEHARLPLSVTATAVTPSPPGKDSLVGRARAGLPYGRPASRGVARSVMVERGGVLLRRPTEATQAPPAMRRCGKMQLLRLVSCGGRLGLLAPDPCQRAFGSLGSHSGGSGWGGGPARGRRAGLARVTPRKGRGATRCMRGSPYPSRQMP